MSSTAPGAARPAAGGKTALTNVRVFDGQQLGPPGTVVIDADRIGAAPAGAQVIDGNGGVLLPGLIDAHVHVRDRDTLERLASFGVTTVLDMANPSPALVDSLRGVPGLTGLRSAGTPALAPGSLHARMLITDERAQIKNADQAGQFVADRVAEGSDYIKIVIGSPGAEHDQATVDALVAAAHEHGKQAVAHAASYAAVAMAQQAGVDVLTRVPLDQALDEASVRRMAADGRRRGQPRGCQPRRQPAPRAGAAGGRRADQPRRVAGRDSAARALLRAGGPGRGRAGALGRPGAHRRR